MKLKITRKPTPPAPPSVDGPADDGPHDGGTGCTCGCGSFGLGLVIAVVVSWSVNHSVGWAIVHGFIGWLYVIYYLLGGGR